MSRQVYQNTSIGESLVETIEELAEEGKLPEQVALAILKQFDLSMAHALQKLVTGKATMKAIISTYKYHDNVWTFNLKDVEFKLNQSGTGSMANAVAMHCDTAKVVVVDANLVASADASAQQ